MAVSIKQFYALHYPDLTEAQQDDIIKVTDALRTENFDIIRKFLENYNKLYKDSVISLSARYLKFNNISFTLKVEQFLSDILHRLRFNSSIKIDTTIAISAPSSLIDYIKDELKQITNWHEKTNLILLYHIKQIVLNSNGLMYDDRFKKLPWKKFVFYLQQYVRYFEVFDENHVFLMTYISLQNLKLFVDLFSIALESITAKKQQSVKNILKSNIETLNTLQTVYDKIRDLYILNRMNKYTAMWKQQHHEDRNMFSGLRVLQVIGESLKDTPLTPNLSKELKKLICDEIGNDQVKTLINIRDNLSHLKRLPFASVGHLYDILYRQFDKLKYSIEEIDYNLKLKTLKELGDKLEVDKIELPNGISLGKLKNLIGNLYFSNKKHSIPKFIYFSQLEIVESCSNVLYRADYLMETNNILGMEFIAMIKLEDLKKNEKRLNDNRAWMKDKYPTLSGTHLRNHLAHGDPVVEMLRIDEFLATKDVIKLLLEDMYSDKCMFIQKVTNVLEIEQQKILIESELNSLQQIQTTLDLIVEGDLYKVKRQLQYVSCDWIYWCNERGENVLQLASRNSKDNVLILELILRNKPDLLESGENTNIPLAISIRKGNKNIAKFLLERHIKVLLNIDKIEDDIDYSDRFDNLLKLNQEQFDELVINKICFIFYCYYISLDNVELLNFASLKTYYLGFEQIFESYDCPFLKIQQLFDAKLVANYFNFNEQIKEVDQTELMKLLENIEQNVLEIKRSRLKTGENALHVAIKCENINMTETIYNKYPYMVLLADNKQQTPFEVALKKNDEFQNKILQLILSNGMNVNELFKNKFYNLIKGVEELEKRVLVFIVGNLYSDNKIVQHWKFKLLSKLITPDEKFNILIKDLNQIKNTYSCNIHIIIEYLKLLVYCLFDEGAFQKRKYYIPYNIIETVESICNPSQVLIMLYNQINDKIGNYEYDIYGETYWLTHLKALVEVQTKSPEIQLFQIKLIHKYNMHRTTLNQKNILYALEAMAKHSTFNDLDDHSYFIWVDVFITTTAMLQEKYIILSYNNEDNIRVQLDNLLNEWNVHDELKIKLLNMRSRNNKYLLITGNKDEIIECLTSTAYVWYQMQLGEDILQFISLNKNIGWEEMKCILETYGENCDEREEHFLLFTMKYVIEYCLEVRNETIFTKLLEVGICDYLISEEYLTKKEIKCATLKDYNINNITELINLLMPRSIFEVVPDSRWHILIYIIHSDNVTNFAAIYNLIYAEHNFLTTFKISPLHIACQCGAFKIVEYLICTGVDLNSLDEYNRSPLYVAVHFEYNKIVKLLSKHGATDTCLHLHTKSIETDKQQNLRKILQSGNVAELEMYLKRVQDIELTRSMEAGNNCLHYAIQSQNIAMIKKVYSKCAHLTITTNYDNISPLDMAVNKDCERIHSSRLLVIEILISLILNDYPIRFAIIKRFLNKNVLKKLALSRPFISSLLFKVMDLLLSDTTDKTLHYWLMRPITDVIEFYYKVDAIDDKLMPSIISLFEYYVSNVSNKQFIIIQKVVALFTFITLRSTTHSHYAEDLIIFITLNMIYITYANGEVPDLPVDIIRNLLRNGKTSSLNNCIILFAVYFIFYLGIERKNMDEMLDRELNLCEMIDQRDAIINLK